MTSFDDAADEIYGALPKAFVSTRKALASAAKAAGDRDLAAQIGALRRPTASAWLVNLLVREAEPQITALLDLGAAMRRAQSRLSADDLRQLTIQRQQVVRGLAAQAHALASDLGESVSRDVLHQVQDTLQAALADPDLAEQVQAGRLTSALSYSGFGPAGLTLVRPVPEPELREHDHAEGPDEDGDAEAEAAAQARAEHERQLAEAREGVDVAARAVVKANRAMVTATESVARADRERARAEQSVAEKQAALDEALGALERATERGAAAAESHDEAEQAQSAAKAALARCKQALADLESTNG